MKIQLFDLKSGKYLVVVLLFSFFSTQAQDFYRKMQEGDANFYEIKKEADAYFKDKDKDKGKGSGYKQYKRWESRAARRLQADGSFRNSEGRKEIYKSRQKPTRAYSGDWKELGPVAVTRKGEGQPGLGRVTAIAVDKNNDQVIFVGSPTGGLWKSVNGGQSWTPKGDQFKDMRIWSIAFDPSNSNRIYIGNNSGEVWQSFDGGNKFELFMYSKDEHGPVTTILPNPMNPDMIYVAIKGNGLYRTTNNGLDLWPQLIAGDVEEVIYKPDGRYLTMYACGHEFYRSHGGSTFNQESTGLTELLPANRIRMAVSADDPTYVYLIQSAGNYFGHLYKSDDSGSDFQIIKSHNVEGTTEYVGKQAYKDMVIAASPSDADRILIGGYDLYSSGTGGQSFSKVCSQNYFNNNYAYIHADIEVLFYQGSKLYTGTDGGIYRSDNDGVDFTNLTEGLGITQIYRVTNSTTDKNRVMVGTQDNGVIVMGTPARSWQTIRRGDGMDGFFHPTDPNIMFSAIQHGSLYKTINGGQSRVKEEDMTNPPEHATGPFDFRALDIAYDNGNRIYIGYKNFYRHDNLAAKGEAWINLSDSKVFDHDNPKTAPPIPELQSTLVNVELSPANNDLVFVSTKKNIYSGTNILSDEASWKLITVREEQFINDIACDPYDENRVVYVTSEGEVYLSNDKGQNWEDLSYGLSNVPVLAVEMDRSPNRGIYVAVDGAIYFRNDNTNGWIPFSTNLPNVEIDDLELFYGAPGEARLRVGTYGRGLWESPLYDEQEGGAMGCPNVVTNYPYNEGFESGFGIWNQLDNDHTDWRLQSGVTPSTGTGPTGAAEGERYIYFETSSPNYPSKFTSLESGCFSLKHVESPEITFRYNMNGANMGALALFISKDGENWDEIWAAIGDQGTDWKTARVYLDEYASENVKFRFTATSGSNWLSDIAVDNIWVQKQTISCGNTITSFPYTEGFESGIGSWIQITTDDANWTVHSDETPSTGTGPTSASSGDKYIYFEVSHGNHPSKTAALKSACIDLTKATNPRLFFRYHMYGSDMGELKLLISANGHGWETIWSKSGDQGNSWKTALLNLYEYSGSKVRLRFVGTSGDDYKGDMALDQIELYNQIDCDNVISNFPYSESFESGFGGWTQGSLNQMDWLRRVNETTSSGTGPDIASQGMYYAYMEASAPNYPSKNTYLESPCFNFSSTSTPFLDFDYHMWGKGVGKLIVQASTNGSGWTTVWEREGDQGAHWKKGSVNLSQYGNKTIQLRFKATSGDHWQGDICVDNINMGISPAPQRDNCLSLDLLLNETPEGSLWELSQYGNRLEASQDYSEKDAGDFISDQICLPGGCYELTIKDGVQNYTIRDLNDNVLLRGVDLEGPVTCEVCDGKVNLKDMHVSSAELKKESILIFPNPAREQLNVQMPSNGEDVRVQLIDLAGRSILDQVFNTSTGMNLFKMDVSEYANGSYLLLISRGESIVKERVIIQD